MLAVSLFLVYFGSNILCYTVSNANLAVLFVSLKQFMSSSPPPLLDLLCYIVCITVKCFSPKIGKTSFGTRHKLNKVHGYIKKNTGKEICNKAHQLNLEIWKLIVCLFWQR